MGRDITGRLEKRMKRVLVKADNALTSGTIRRKMQDFYDHVPSAQMICIWAKKDEDIEMVEKKKKTTLGNTRKVKGFVCDDED